MRLGLRDRLQIVSAGVSNGAGGDRPTLTLPVEPIALDGVPLEGASQARVVMLVLSDFECPFCARFANDIMPSVRAEYVKTGRIKVGFRHMPLPMHARAQRAAESAECAARQGRFWPMHDSLFTAPMRLSEADLVEHARVASVDLSAFNECMRGEAEERVSDDRDFASSIGVSATPSFLVGTVDAGGNLRATEAVVGARPLKDFAAVFDRLLSALP